ncbi:uncharacterized protein LOC128641606 [Bombina bombina]|uniref:uncharacterized protein LOC128641606 n=1 Tax=Bombina bombina TaxID=8345 RepID=UPI00235B29BF|nr:uncharacterized protein LOC128641606 [Bombina bombina]
MSPIVGVFSRSGKEEYSWLTQSLESVASVHPWYISNSNGSKLRGEVKKCDFAILYHTKRRGRVNITNVTDSLYDEELNIMSQTLGKEKVIVVVDDLDDSGPGVKNRILQDQTNIRDQARDIFLFSTADKQNRSVMEKKLEDIKYILRPTHYIPPSDISTPRNSASRNDRSIDWLLAVFLVFLCAGWTYIIPYDDIYILFPMSGIIILNAGGSFFILYAALELETLPVPVSTT